MRTLIPILCTSSFFYVHEYNFNQHHR